MSDSSVDFYALRKRLVDSNSLFVDRDFPPELQSISPSGVLPRGSNIRKIEWKRPVHLTRNPKFVTATATRSDLDQGALGNCWFVAAASLLVNGPKEQFERVIPLDQGFDPHGYAGIFHFKFWWYGVWREIIIDDFLPTDGHNLLYCSNWEEKDEFWGALLEKAYAKLRGSYMALDGGKITDALVDFTGGLGEIIYLRGKNKDVPPNFYDLLWKCSKMNSLIGGAIHLPENATRPEVRRNNGLFMGHAYSITALSVVPYNSRSVKLLRIRNPWGRKEWTGAWSDNSPEIRNLPMDVKRKLNIVIEEDGEFWISFDDFMANFDECQLCHLQPDAVAKELANNTLKQNWSVTVYHDAWIKGVTAGGCGNSPHRDLYWKNPQFFIRLKDPDATDDRHLCTMIVSLMEKEKGDVDSETAIGFDVYEIKDSVRRPLDGSSLSKSDLIHRERSGIYQHHREVVKRFELPPGNYILLPSTFYPHQESEFMIRIHTEKEVESEVLDETVLPSTPVVSAHDNLSSLFTRYAGEDGKMDYKELRQYLIEATKAELKEPIAFNREACRSLVTMMDLNRSGFLSSEEGVHIVDQVKTYLLNKSGYLDMDEARRLYQDVRGFMAVFRQFDTDNTNSVDTLELGTMFNKLGFPVSRMVLTSIVRRYGGRDHKIGLEDFIIVICKLIVMYSIFKQQQKKTGGPDDVAQFTRNEFLQYTMFC